MLHVGFCKLAFDLLTLLQRKAENKREYALEWFSG